MICISNLKSTLLLKVYNKNLYKLIIHSHTV